MFLIGRSLQIFILNTELWLNCFPANLYVSKLIPTLHSKSLVENIRNSDRKETNKFIHVFVSYRGLVEEKGESKYIRVQCTNKYIL